MGLWGAFKMWSGVLTPGAGLLPVGTDMGWGYWVGWGLPGPTSPCAAMNECFDVRLQGVESPTAELGFLGYWEVKCEGGRPKVLPCSLPA